MRSRATDAEALLRQALELERALGDRLGEASTLRSLGDAARLQDRHPAAIAHYEQALPIYREIGSRSGEAAASVSYALALAAQARPRPPTC
jgi:tetratricopeptide (TPR) repeat protein